MTLIGKLLALINLVAGLGVLVWSVSVYSLRPGWFDPAPKSVYKGNTPLTFAQLKEELAALDRAVNLASLTWGEQKLLLEKAEARRADRLKKYEQRLQWARTGNPDQGGAAFFLPVYLKDAGGKDTGILDLDTLGPPVEGPDKQPLRGADTLLANFAADVRAVAELVEQSLAARKEYDNLGSQIEAEEARLLKMIDIRDAVQNELFYLSAVELRAYEGREIVLARKRQLVQRLTELGGAGK